MRGEYPSHGLTDAALEILGTVRVGARARTIPKDEAERIIALRFPSKAERALFDAQVKRARGGMVPDEAT